MTATDFFTNQFGRPPQTYSDKLMVAMMAEYAEAVKNDKVDTKPVLSSTNLEPYCTDCGSEDLQYLDQYANGEYWKCEDCGKQFIHKLHSH